ncbi:HET-domain-containing protein [Xylaria acuta]|nr:HET-domain-containing protein [Xylaria acuta]
MTSIDELAAQMYHSLIQQVEMLGILPHRDHASASFAIRPSSVPKILDLPPSSLCRACNDMSIEQLESEDGYTHSEDIEALLLSSESCAACNLIRKQIYISMDSIPWDKTIEMNENEALKMWKLMWSMAGFNMQKMPIILKVRKLAFKDMRLVVGTLLRQQGGSTMPTSFGELILHQNSKDARQLLRPRGSQEDTLGLLCEWLGQRLEDRVQSNMKPTLPTRVLDLGSGDGDEAMSFQSDLRLKETAGQHGEYVALSYCWGGYQGFRTTKESYAERLNKIEYNLLPALFADAIKVTRGLKIRYLWIDALCIVQEDKEDWQQEAAKMSEIYSNAACRLAVTDSRNPTQGFFPPLPILTSVQLPKFAKLQVDYEDAEPSSCPKEEDHSQNDALENPSLRPFWSQERPSHTVRTQTEGSRSEVSATPERHVSSSSLKGDGVSRINNGSENEPSKREEGDEQCDSNQEAKTRSEQDHVGDVMTLFKRNIRIYEEQEEKVWGKGKETLSHFYLTLPISYSWDVDNGHLNTRAWVLQERLLSPRTIHFTKEHIYCENEDDICGEDWIRRHFTWLSCIDKISNYAQSILFPEQSVNDERPNRSPEFEMAQYPQEVYHIARDPWLNIVETYSRCHLSYQTDRLAAITGLVNAKQRGSNSDLENTRNLLGLRENTLHIDLAWLADKRSILKFLSELGLPSWTWIAYQGPIVFTRDRRSYRREDVTIALPVKEFRLLNANVSNMTTPLPLVQPASLTLEMTIRKISKIGKGIPPSAAEHLPPQPPPFYLQAQRTPIPFTALTGCHEILDGNQALVGYVSFDDRLPDVAELYCALLSTVRDEPPTPRSGNLGRPVVAYSLVVTKIDGEKDKYRRCGLAETSYGWITNGTRGTVTLL